MRLILTIAAILITGFFLTGFIPRLFTHKELKRMEEETVGATQVVRTVIAEPAPMEETGFLPGNISAFQYATIFARVDGYLKTRLVDIGDHVKTGQLLAEIDTPTVDQEVAQSQANLEQAKAQLVTAQASLKEAEAQAQAAAAQVAKATADKEYAEVTAGRWQRMADKGAVSVQSRDEKNRAFEAQTANLSAADAQKKAADQQVEAARSQVRVAQAEVLAKQAAAKRYQEQQQFKFVRAPFDGVITLRKVDPGALITSGSQSQNLELFQLAKIDDLRIYINVPQSISRYLKTGEQAVVNVPEFPERDFDGTISNISGGLDPQTRTRQTEIRISNEDHILLPGMYAQVHLKIGRQEPWLKLNSNVVVPREGTTEVAVVENGHAHFKKVQIGRDFGDQVEIRAGLNRGDVAIVSPPVDLQEGEAVKATPLDAQESEAPKSEPAEQK